MNFSHTPALSEAHNPFIHEPAEDQRWSTWPSVIPTLRGPKPHPDWIVTDHGAFDTELGVLKTGKEADVHLIERAVPGRSGVILAAKRYRENTAFSRTSDYDAGRATGNSREARAIRKKTAFGRSAAASQWAIAEFEALSRAWEAGVPVPYPVQIHGTELLLEFIGDGRAAAPRLAQATMKGAALVDTYDQVVEILRVFARIGHAHGDLSPYNLLDDHGRIVVIDLPQTIDLIANPMGMDFLHRDVVNMCTWFTRRGLECDPEALFAEILTEMW